MDTASIIEQVGGDVQGPIALDPSDYGPWFKLMTREALSSDEQLGGRDIGSLNLEAALGLPGAGEPRHPRLRSKAQRLGRACSGIHRRTLGFV